MGRVTTKRSAGLLLYRLRKNGLEVLLVHPGGPFWAKKDAGVWSIPKGEFADGEEPLAAARREFLEETGWVADGPFLELGTVRQAGGKVVWAWACEGEFDPALLVSNTCTIEWPPRSGRRLEIPEVDRGGWFGMEEARAKMVGAQTLLLDRLMEALSARAERTATE